MTVSYIKKITARRCPVHQTLLEMAGDDLSEVGYFHKDQLLERSRMTAMSSSIRWDYIADFIKEDNNCELIPLAPRFWKMTPEQRLHEPEKALAGGHGKKTAGYALVSEENAALCVRRLEHKRSMANGVGKAFRTFANELESKDGILEEDQKLLSPVSN